MTANPPFIKYLFCECGAFSSGSASVPIDVDEPCRDCKKDSDSCECLKLKPSKLEGRKRRRPAVPESDLTAEELGPAKPEAPKPAAQAEPPGPKASSAPNFIDVSGATRKIVPAGKPLSQAMAEAEAASDKDEKMADMEAPDRARAVASLGFPAFCVHGVKADGPGPNHNCANCGGGRFSPRTVSTAMLQHSEAQEEAFKQGVSTQLDMPPEASEPLGYGEVERDAPEAKSKTV